MGVFLRNGAWYIRYRLPGTNKKKWQKIGPNKRQAELAYAQVRIAKAKGALGRTLNTKPIKLHALLDRYEKHAMVTRAPSSLRGLRWILRKLKTLPDGPANALSRDTLHQWLYSQREAGLHAGTIANLYTELLRAYNLATNDWQLLAANPLNGSRFPWQIKNQRTRFLTPEQVEQALAALRWPWSGMARVAVYTGLRKAEVYNLKWDDIDLERGYLQVRHGKGDKFRMVPLIPSLKAWLQSLPRFSPWLFTSPKGNGPYRSGTLHGWKEALEEAGITDFRFHDLRHTTATLLRMSGVDLQTIGEILGHSNLRFTQRYAHLPEANRIAAMGRLEQITKGEAQLPTQLPPNRNKTDLNRRNLTQNPARNKASEAMRQPDKA